MTKDLNRAFNRLISIIIIIDIFLCVFFLLVGWSLILKISIFYSFFEKLIENPLRLDLYGKIFLLFGLLLGSGGVLVLLKKNWFYRPFLWLYELGTKKAPCYKEPRKPIYVLCILVFLSIGIVTLFLALTNKTYYVQSYIAEDHFVENASFFFWILASVFFLLSYRKQAKTQTTTLIYFAFILLCLLLGMEEISWGQRIWGFKGPSLITQHNLQHEFNFHDIGSISLQENAFFLFTVLLYLVIPVARESSSFFSNLFENIGWPISSKEMAVLCLIMLVVWVAVGIIMGTLGFWPLSWKGYYNQCDDEIFELYAAMLFCANGLLDLCAISKKVVS